MKRATRMHKAAWLVLTLPLIAVALTFQNCSKVDFKATTNPSVAGTGEKVAMYANMTVGQANVPPLKLIFVVDNSYTMQANQISLSSAFGSLFTGQNATNLSPFESTAYIFTTSQASIAPSSPSFGLLPSVSYDQMKSMSFSDLSAMRGSASAQVDGKFAGDIVSYSVSNLPDPVTLLNSWSYIPTPVLGLTATGASAPVELGVHKEKSGSVGDFAAAFSDRISYISPLRSKYDSAGHGLLDPVTDHESGLCALARVLKNNSGFLQKGDLAAFVIVSDEDDNDPSGSSCVDAYKEYKDADLIDAHCETPTTDIAYNAKNTVAPTCRLNYQTGFTYTAKYDAPITKFAFDDAYHKYQSAQATVTYATASYTYDRYKYVAHSYKKSPTYAVPQVQVSWYTKSTACKERDGVKFDCVDSFTQRSAQVNGTYNGSNCSTLSSSVASNAVKNDASHPIACAQGTPSPRSGACDPNDKTIVDCQQNYSKLGDVALYSDSNQAKCSDLIVGRLPSGAIDSGEPSAYLPTCEQPVAVRTNSNGFCTSAKANCVANAPVTGLKKTVSQAYTGSNCPTLIAAANLPSNAITSAGDPRSPTCANTPVWDSKATAGACPTALPSGKVACENSRQPHSGGATASGQPASGQSCQDFAETSHTLPSNAILSSVTCTAATTPSNASRVVTYDSSYPNLVVKAGDACPSSILADVKSSYGSSATCTIASVSQPTKTYQGTCADNAGAIAILCSSAANHGCSNPVDNQSSANQPYQTSLSHKTAQGTVTCDTKCTDAYGACGSVSVGTVGDVYHGCVATPGQTLKSSSQTGLLASKKDSLCADPAKVVVDRSYHTTGTMPQYVAGSASAASDPNALINYIKTRSNELLGSELPATSVFVRQTDGGNGGTEGKAYKAFAASMGGENHDVNAPASEYASSLQSLGGVIKEKLARSFSIQGFTPDQKVQRVWYQAQGTSAWIEKTEGTEWTASGGTVTVSPSFDMHAGDNFRVEYK